MLGCNLPVQFVRWASTSWHLFAGSALPGIFLQLCLKLLVCVYLLNIFHMRLQVKWKDVTTDLNLGTARFDVERTDHNQYLPLTMRVLKAILPTEEVTSLFVFRTLI